MNPLTAYLRALFEGSRSRWHTVAAVGLLLVACSRAGDDGILAIDGESDDSLELEEARSAPPLKLPGLEHSHLTEIADWLPTDRRGRLLKGSGWRLHQAAAATRRRFVTPIEGRQVSTPTDIPNGGLYRIWLSHRLHKGKCGQAQVRIGERILNFGELVLQLHRNGSELEQQHPIRFESEFLRLGSPPADCIVWEYHDVNLPAGPTTIELSAVNKASPPIVEALFLTQSRDFRPSRSANQNERTLDKTWFRIRLSNVKSSGPVRDTLLYRAQRKLKGHPGMYYTGWLRGHRGAFRWPEADEVNAGEGWSQWVDGTNGVTAGGHVATCRLHFPPSAATSAEIQMAWHPEPRATLKQITVELTDREAAFLLPVENGLPSRVYQGAEPLQFGMRAPFLLRRFRSISDVEAEMTQHANTAQPNSLTTPLRRIRLHTFNTTARKHRKESIARLRRLGINWTTPPPPDAEENGLFPEDIILKYVQLDDPFDADYATKLANHFTTLAKRRRKAAAPPIYAVKLGDEIGAIASAAEVNASPIGQQLYHEYVVKQLAACGKSLEWLGATNISDLQCLSRNEFEASAPPPLQRQYYFSQRFLVHLTNRHYETATRAIRAAFPEARTFANYAVGFMFGSRMHHGWFSQCRSGATTVAWAEDWAWAAKGTASAGLQTVSFYGAILDCAARPGEKQKGFHTIATANHAARKIFSLLGEGVFWQDLYMYGPAYLRKGGHIDCWSEKHWVYKQIAAATSALAPAEEFVVAGQQEAARVAVLVNVSDDNRTDSEIPGFLSERLMTYLAFRHEQMPVDLVLEDDLTAETLAPYRVLYIHGLRLHERAIPGLRKWVEKGGTLVAVAGTGMANQFGDALPQAIALFGATQQLESVQSTSWHGDQLPKLTPIDFVSMDPTDLSPAARVPVIGIKGVIKPTSTGQIIGRYEDGSVAAFRRAMGKGVVLFYGFLPGMSYRSTAARVEGARHKLVGYRDALRRVITKPLLAHITPSVRPADPLVETTVFQHPKATAILLNDFSWEAGRRLNLQLGVKAPPKEVVSTSHGKLTWKLEGDFISIVDCPPPNPVDVIIIYHQ